MRREGHNDLLASLGSQTSAALTHRLEPVLLRTREVLAESGERLKYVYFPTAGVVSRLGSTAEGRSIELACTGREGVVGALNALADGVVPYRLITQVSGSALRMEAAELRRAVRSHPRFLRLLNCYATVLLTQLAQAAVCARFHTSRQRLARWLLTAAERAGVGDLPWSHEWVSEMVGGPRSAVSAAAASLKNENIISYRRMGIKVLDHAALESAACECVHVVRHAIQQFVETCES